MGLTVHINYEAEIDEWIKKYPYFKFINESEIPRNKEHRWIVNDEHWKYTDIESYQWQIMFIGKTGYGKSTTLNKLVGRDVFQTSDVSVCTKDLYNAMYRIKASIPSFLSISDLPGIGESNYADNHYLEWYKDMLESSQVVVYLLRADQRDFAIDEMIFDSMFIDPMQRSKVILALNYADKVEPINRKEGLSKQQVNNLDKKVKEVASIFNFCQQDIVYYSATDGINIEYLVQKIADKFKSNI